MTRESLQSLTNVPLTFLEDPAFDCAILGVMADSDGKIKVCYDSVKIMFTLMKTNNVKDSGAIDAFLTTDYFYNPHIKILHYDNPDSMVAVKRSTMIFNAISL